jgi:hypothetical protein
MIKNRQAAKCGYVEKNRRDMAINFVVDAFNGKVDSLLASAKRGNASTLIQEIKDAYTLVNMLGQPFKNARISYNYCDSRIEELKWLVRVNELIQRRKDEQRALKEEDREVAKAVREAEKAFAKAQKEISILNMERNDIALKIKESENDAEKNELLKKLRELEERLKEKNVISVRAKSMAEFTSTGSVYVISNRGSFGEHIVKIGSTRRWYPEERVHELFNASIPFPYDIHAIIQTDNAPRLEMELHNRFTLKQTIAAQAQQYVVKFTMT